jgi:hypothetical protein
MEGDALYFPFFFFEVQEIFLQVFKLQLLIYNASSSNYVAFLI